MNIDKFGTMHFDGAKSQAGVSAGIVLISPKNEEHCFSFLLEFDGTNNTVEYKSLLLGFNIAKDYGIKLLHIIGDSDLIVCQVKGKISWKKT